MISRTLSLIRTEWITFFTFAVFLAGLNVAEERKYIGFIVSFAANYILTLFFVFLCQASILMNIRFVNINTNIKNYNFSYISYIMKYTVIFGCGAGPAIISLYYFDDVIHMTNASRIAAATTIVIVTIFTLTTSLALLGTWLSAEISGGRKGFLDTLARGKMSFFKTFKNLFAVVFLQGLSAIATTTLLLALQNSDWRVTGWGLALEIFISVIGAAIGLMLTCMIFIYAALLFHEHNVSTGFEPVAAAEA